MIRVVHTHTVVNDTALRELQGRLQGLRDRCATVGWHAAEGTRPKLVRRAKGSIAANWRMNVASIALVHETGSYERMIPARPVHRTAFRNPDFRRQLVVLASSEYRGLLHGKKPEIVLHNLGSFWRTRFDRVFDGENNWPALSDSTLIRRYTNGNYSDQPLVDTRQMRDTTTSKVQMSALVERPVWDGQ
jgi:hypothetical protein